MKKNDSPYITTDLHYYAKPTISGPSTVCTTGSTFTIPNPPAGYTVQWSISGTDLTLSCPIKAIAQ